MGFTCDSRFKPSSLSSIEDGSKRTSRVVAGSPILPKPIKSKKSPVTFDRGFLFYSAISEAYSSTGIQLQIKFLSP